MIDLTLIIDEFDVHVEYKSAGGIALISKLWLTPKNYELQNLKKSS